MKAYIYQADVYCEDCGRAINARCRGIDRGSETYPQGPHDESECESDCPQHCGSGPDCLNALQVGEYKVGCWLENPLTAAGVHYVIEAVREGGLVSALWAQWYREELKAEGIEV